MFVITIILLMLAGCRGLWAWKDLGIKFRYQTIKACSQAMASGKNSLASSLVSLKRLEYLFYSRWCQLSSLWTLVVLNGAFGQIDFMLRQFELALFVQLRYYSVIASNCPYCFWNLYNKNYFKLIRGFDWQMRGFNSVLFVWYKSKYVKIVTERF